MYFRIFIIYCFIYLIVFFLSNFEKFDTAFCQQLVAGLNMIYGYLHRHLMVQHEYYSY